MTAVQLLDTADLPDGGQLRLLQRGQDFSIRFRDEELMGNQVRHSEQALAALTCARLGHRSGRILIGGLGMGFTLGAALRAWPSDSRIVVAELVPKIVTWAKGPLAHIFGDHLTDPRVTLEMADVHDVIVRETGRETDGKGDNDGGGFDAILLDVDNGPDGLIHIANERLYSNWGLRAAGAALKPGGILAIWSAYPDTDFVDRLDVAGFDVDEVAIPATAGQEDVTHIIWLASKKTDRPLQRRAAGAARPISDSAPSSP